MVLTLHPQNYSDEITSAPAVGLDEIAFRRMNAELLKSKVTNFLADMTHEIRTPVGAIIGLGRILMATELDDKQRQCLNVLQSSAEALLALVNRTLDISKIESKATDLQNAPFDMVVLLSEIADIMLIKAQEKNVGLTLHYEAAIPETVVGDSGYIRQIITNLVGNAIKFTETGEVIMSFVRRENEISISVGDTGIGISKDKIDLIFDRFVQADRSIGLKYGGTGLGLSISKALAEKMGGSITVHSVMGEGSTFVFNLPLSAEVSDRGNVIYLNMAKCQKLPCKP